MRNNSMARILIADSDLAARESIARAIARIGCVRVDLASDGNEALHRLASKFGRYDLAILDLMLPELSGLDVLRNVTRKGIRTDVVIVTPHLGSARSAVACLQAGAVDYILKPMQMDVFAKAMQSLLDKKVNPDSPAEARNSI